MNELKRTFILKSNDPDVIETAGVDTFEMPIDDVIKYFQVSPTRHRSWLLGHASDTRLALRRSETTSRW